MAATYGGSATFWFGSLTLQTTLHLLQPEICSWLQERHGEIEYSNYYQKENELNNGDITFHIVRVSHDDRVKCK